MPRRRRGARAVAIEAEAERGLLMRILLHSPKDMVAGVLAFAAVSAIIANALFLQTGPPSGADVRLGRRDAAGGVDRRQSVAASAPGRRRRSCLRIQARRTELRTEVAEPRPSIEAQSLPSRKRPSPKPPIR